VLKTSEHFVLNQLPSEEEFKLVIDTATDLNALDSPEKYVLMCHGIPNFRERLQALSFLCHFYEEAEQLLDGLMTLHQALRELMESKKLKLFFGLVLRTGNYLNNEMTEIQAICVDSLRAIPSMKNIDNSFNLLDFMVHVFENVLFHDRFDIVDELEHVPAAAIGWSFNELQNKVIAMDHQFNQVFQFKQSLSDDDPLVHVLLSFEAKGEFF
jgi:hypothetical protein